jgi:hypothetical protein
MSKALIETAAVEQVRAALDGQVQAWNNGNLEEAMSYYWDSPEMLWVSKSGIDTGYISVLEMFRKDFSDRSTMGIYSYVPLFIEEISPEAVYYVFEWKIELNGKQLMGCISSQLWKKVNDNWIIRAEHAS